jgi:serine/threonine-protein kinase
MVPLWTPDGKRIAFNAYRDESSRLYWKSADNTGKAELLGSDYGEVLVPLPSSWTPDGKILVSTDYAAAGTVSFDIGALSMDGERKSRALLKKKYAETEPKISPDGRWMAYASDRSGMNEIYVRPFPEVDSMGPWQVSTKGGNSPLWSPDGRELFYRNGDAVVAVSVMTDPTFSRETPKTLFRGTYDSFSDSISTSSTSLGVNTIFYLNSWDIHPDGKRFLMLKPAATADNESTPEIPCKINIVVNWFEEWKGRVSAN